MRFQNASSHTLRTVCVCVCAEGEDGRVKNGVDGFPRWTWYSKREEGNTEKREKGVGVERRRPKPW